MIVIGALVMAFVHGEGIGERRRGTTRPSHEDAVMSAVAGYVSSQVAHFLDGERGLPGHDSFYHTKMAAMLPEWGLVERFDWLRFVYFTQKTDEFVSHHYGYHAAMVPFVLASKALTGDYLAGGRWSTEFFFGVVLAIYNLLLRQAGIRRRGVWLLLFFALPSQFYSRHAFVRAISPSLAFMLAICWLAFSRRHVLLALAVAGYTHLYLGAVMYSPVIVASFALACVLGRGGFRQFPVAAVLAGVIGWALGAVTHPYAGGMIDFLRLQVFATGLDPNIEVGSEWKSYSNLWWFVRHQAGVVLGVWTIAVIIRARRGPRLTAGETALLILHFAFLLLTFKARRFIEYWPAFCLLSAAVLAGPWLDRALAWLFDEPKGQPSSASIPPQVVTPAGAVATQPSIATDWMGLAFALALVAGLVWIAAYQKGGHAIELARAWPLSMALVVYAIWRSSCVRVAAANARQRRVIRLRDGLVAAAAVIALAIPSSKMWLDVRRSAENVHDLENLRPAMAYLVQNSNPGDVVFTTDWDDFPVFFYLNSHNYYVVGLDPKFTHERRPDLWERYVRITRGQVPRTSKVKMFDAAGRSYMEKLRVEISDIREHFQARYVVTDRDHKSIAQKLARQKSLAQLVYPEGGYDELKDEPYLIFRISDAGTTTAPSESGDSAGPEAEDVEPANPSSRPVPPGEGHSPDNQAL